MYTNPDVHDTDDSQCTKSLCNNRTCDILLLSKTKQEDTTVNKAIGYIRVSTAMQADEGVSLDAQRAKIEAWCSLNDYELAAVHVDAGISGKKMKNRPGLQDAMADCGKGSVLVVYSLSRLSRSIRDTMDISERLEKTGSDLVSLSEKIDTTSAAGRVVFRMLSVMAQFESEQISERVTTAMQYKKSQGGRVGTVPFGKRLDADNDSLIEDEDEMLVVAAVHHYRNAGLSMRTIVTRLEEQGYKARSGKPLQLTQVARILNVKSN